MKGSRYLAACRREPVDRPPIWVMRQAGRYLPEYRAVRARAGSFLALCRNPELAAEVTLQPVRRFGFDAAIVFSDILLPLAPLGLHFAFPEQGGPRLAERLATPESWAAVTLPPDDSGTHFVAEAVARARAALPSEVALIGFCGAPWTLASYVVEGGTSRDHARVRAALHRHPEAFGRLLDVLAEAMGRYLRQQVEAGADAVMVFDSWAGTLAAPEYARSVLPSLTRLLGAVADRAVPRTLYLGGGAHLLPLASSIPCEVVAVDWRTDLAAAARAVGAKAVQGNLDPAVLLAGPAATAQAARAMLAESPERGYIVNLGHGILPETPLESVHALLAAVRGTA